MPRDQRLIDLMERCAAATAEGRDVDTAELCSSCPELLPELERLQRFDQRMEQLLASLFSLDTLPPADTSAPSRVNAFPVVPGYAILRELAAGSMGQVYHARDIKLERDVALKVIRPDRLSSDLLSRFSAEARAVARLDHPHIVGIFEVGEYASPEGGPAAPFLALEFVRGGTLEERAGSHPMPAGEAARIVCLLARALAHAHARGIVHRDLKPANILIAPPAEEVALNAAIGRPKIGDFGLARRQDSTGAGMTGPGAIMGTPAYMAPEQAEGKSAGPPADVYALGAILYRLLTGRAVFESDSVVNTLHAVCNTRPRPPHDYAAGIPPALEALCLRCLSKSPGERPSAAALAAALAADPDTIPMRQASLRPRTRRRFLAVAVACAATVALAVPLAVLAWRLSRRPVVPPVAAPVQEPLKGFLDAEMSRPGDPLRQYRAMNDPASRPMRPGDEIRVRAEFNRPTYVYLVWIDSAGVVTPMYPWIEGEWNRRGSEERKIVFKLPRKDGQWGVWRMGPGKQGFETMVLLCRDDPLPDDEDLKLKEKLGRFDPVPTAGQNLGSVAWFENGEIVRDEPLRSPMIGTEPRAPLAKPMESGNPLERLNREIHQRVKEWFNYTRAITYGNEGN